MILKIRNSKLTKVTSLTLIVVFISTLNPMGAYALTGGPAQPEFNSFTPIGTSDMVDLASGDFSYNIPLMDVGGFPINLAYSSGVNMDQEASWVGLGWDLSIGQINRQMRGIPDDFDGEQMNYENNLKDNYTIGASINAEPALFGFKTGLMGDLPVETNVGISMQYNSYNGIGIQPSYGVTYKLAEIGSIAFNVSSGPDGLSLNPSASLKTRYGTSKRRDVNGLGLNAGLSFNSRQGLSAINMSASSSVSSLKSQKTTGGKNLGQYKTSGSIGSSLSYVNNTYTPNIQDGIISENFTFNASVGAEFWGAEVDGQIRAFGSNQYIHHFAKVKNERAYGYNYTHKSNSESVLDFNREKDGNFSVNSTNLPITNYTYDIYSVKGQGVGGMFRPYRSQIGYVHDNETNSFGAGVSLGGEVGAGAIAHFGGDVEASLTKSRSGVWSEENGNNAIENFEELTDNGRKYEEVYFKNVGDLGADEDRAIYGTQVTGPGGFYPARLAIGGSAYNRTVESAYEIKKGSDENSFYSSSVASPIKRDDDNRVRRNQAILNVTVLEARTAVDAGGPMIGFKLDESVTVGDNQTAGYVITRNDGARYVYGAPLYNTTKREATFALGDEVGGDIAWTATDGSKGDPSTGLIEYTPGVDNSINNTKGDHYFNRITTPAYAHTYLLTTLLSSDYSDVDGFAGPSPNDYGSYTLFEYVDMGQYKWRVPYLENKANFNEGFRTDPTDDKGSYVYGEKEQSYIQKIETKTHVAIFDISERRDGHGVDGENGSPANANTSSKMYKLDKITLYSRGEYYDADGVTINPDAIPIKTAHFEYDYALCQGIPNNDLLAYDGDADGVADDNQGGKLTLRKVYFTYRNSNMGKYSAYDFAYGDKDHDGTEDAERNPGYNLKGYDIWGNYKPNNGTTNDFTLDPISAPAFNYVDQDDPNADDYAAAWSITDIELPSGGRIKIDYEADDYAYVQNKRAMQMYKLAGAGPDRVPTGAPYFDPTNALADQHDQEALLFKAGPDKEEAKYLYFKLALEDQDLSLSDAQSSFYEKYLKQIDTEQKGLVQFRVFMNTNKDGGKHGDWQTKGNFEYVSGYFELITQVEDLSPEEIADGATQPWTVFEHEGAKYGSIRMKLVEKGDPKEDDEGKINPIAKAGWQFGRKYLPKYVYGFPEPDPSSSKDAIVNTIIGTVDGVMELFSGPNGTLRRKKNSRRFIPEKSWIRLSNSNGKKKGGGCRVKQLVMTDEWGNMTSGDPGTGLDQKYGQEYTYTLEDGTSSGVATYEPIGAKDNPLVQPVFVNVNRMLAPDEENYVEKPFGESFFPSPAVTYSRVAVKNIERIHDNDTPLDETDDIRLTRNATGKVITEFYTSKDFPVVVDQTKLSVEEDEPNVLGQLLSINHKKHLTLSQGYLIHLNDMNGKMKSQRVYAEGKPEAISGVDYHYDQFGSADVEAPDLLKIVSNNIGKINNTVKVLYPNGVVADKALGQEFDVINDFREKESVTKVVGVNANVATFLVGLIPGIVPLPLPDYARHEDNLSMSTTTKVINTFGIQREVVAYDAGAAVSTKNLLWDANTGEVLLTETVNEYGDNYYSLNLPAYWHYKGMGMAYENLGTTLPVVDGGGTFSLGEGLVESAFLNNGDEVILGGIIDGNISVTDKAWVHDVSPSSFKLIDKTGADIVLGAATHLRVLRSGKRNLQPTSMGSVVMQINPLDFVTAGNLPMNFLESADWSTLNMVNAGAVEFNDDWTLQCECGMDPDAEISNPYFNNTKGVWRANRSWLYLTGRHHATDNPSPRNDGFYSDFKPFYRFNGSGWEIAEEGVSGATYTSKEETWTFTSEVTQYSPYGFELENADALDRFSAAQYGYNFSFPLSVGANSEYSEMGYDGFEDYSFSGCPENEHFGFRDAEGGVIDDTESHTGKKSMRVAAGTSVVKKFRIGCGE